MLDRILLRRSIREPDPSRRMICFLLQLQVMEAQPDDDAMATAVSLLPRLG